MGTRDKLQDAVAAVSGNTSGPETQADLVKAALAESTGENAAKTPAPSPKELPGLLSEAPQMQVGSVRLPRRYVWLDLPAEYGQAGMKIKIWVNAPASIVNGFWNLDGPERIPYIQEIFVEHNGWLWEDGTPMVPCSDPTFFDALPREIWVTLLALWQDAINTLLPNSLSATKN